MVKQENGGCKVSVRFYDEVDDSLLKFAVILTKARGKWVFCKHRERDTFEIPGGHREAGEEIFATAKRELNEETGAINFHIEKVCVYSVVRDGNEEQESFGMLYYAEVEEFEEIHSEIEKIIFADGMVERLTYPEIQPKLMEKWISISA